MEDKLNGLLELLQTQKQSSKELTPVLKTPTITPQQFLDVTGSESWSGIDINDNLFPSGTSSTFPFPTSTSPMPVFNFPGHLFDGMNDCISKGMISFTQADECVTSFRSKEQLYFPFVVIPQHMTLDTLRRERPFLLLSVLVCSAQDNAKLQEALELELRETMSRRVHVDGEKSLDLLQGVLVYLTW